MDITKIIKKVGNPTPYDKGTDMMWTDRHISKFLLKAHINPEIGVASRTSTDIDKTVGMIDKMVSPGSEILDLGCGPGLYAERLSKKGYKVTGVDFSKNSIDYAIKQRGKNQSTIVEKIFRPIGFSKVESINNLLTGSGPYNDHGVVFYAVSK
jgi:SAM-dependent methyltransferase